MYFRDLDQEQFERNIQEKAEWNEVCSDPVFADIASACDAISISELIRRRNDETLVLGGSEEEAEGSDYDAGSRDQYSDDERYLPERSYNERSETTFAAKRPVSRSPSRTSTAEEQNPTRSIENEEEYSKTRETEDQRLSREQEERLAALGVSGLPKPVQSSMRRTVAVTEPLKAVLTSPVEATDRQSRSTSLDRR